MTDRPKISFGVIVLNGEPFTRYCLRSLYPFAHEIIVSEGAAKAAAGVSTPDGHSLDGTLDILREFKEKEDPEDKIIIVTAEDEGHPDGFWPDEKHAQSQAYASRATGDWLWQIDVDEFYREDHMDRVLDLLASDPDISAISFPQITFFGDIHYLVDGWALRRRPKLYHRLFRWRPGYTYASHRPPTVIDDNGRDLRSLHWVDEKTIDELGVYFFHYSLLFPKQVREKGEYYKNAQHRSNKSAEWDKWMKESYYKLEKPYRVHNLYKFPGWLARFSEPHPRQIFEMMNDIRCGKISVERRNKDDIEQLLDSWWYPIGVEGLKALEIISRRARRTGSFFKQNLLSAIRKLGLKSK